MRCPACEATRWQLSGLALERSTACDDCGAELVPERRVPGRFTGLKAGERREAPPAPAPPA